MVKIGLSVLLAATTMAVVPFAPSGEPVGLGLLLTREAVIGLALGFGVRLVIGAAEYAGHLAGFQLGFAYASVVDPQSGVRNNVLGSMYGLTALMVFFAINAHHDVVRALVLSYDVLPIGAGGVDASLGGLVGRMMGVVFFVGVQMAAPIIIVQLLVELGLGLAARAAPMLNLMAQGFPIRLLVGLLTLAAMIRVIPTVVERSVPVALELAARVALAFE
jgi:flagellar biosynthetic protein FliR